MEASEQNKSIRQISKSAIYMAGGRQFGSVKKTVSTCAHLERKHLTCAATNIPPHDIPRRHIPCPIAKLMVRMSFFLEPSLLLTFTSKSFTEHPLSITDFSSALPTPNMIDGRGKLVYWHGCTSAAIAQREENRLQTVQKLKPAGGQGILENGLILYCKDGKMGEVDS